MAFAIESFDLYFSRLSPEERALLEKTVHEYTPKKFLKLPDPTINKETLNDVLKQIYEQPVLNEQPILSETRKDNRAHPTCALCHEWLSVVVIMEPSEQERKACPCVSLMEDDSDIVERWDVVYTFERVGVRRLACKSCSQSQKYCQQFSFKAIQHLDGSCRCLPPVSDRFSEDEELYCGYDLNKS